MADDPMAYGRSLLEAGYNRMVNEVIPSTPVGFAADLGAPAAMGDIVTRIGKLFECGDYPDKAFTFDAADLERAVTDFQPVPIDLEHTPTVLDGKLGTVTRVFADGSSLMGEVHLPTWLDSLLADGERKVSAEWDRATKRLQKLSLVLNPRVTDAALMAAFSESQTPTPHHRRTHMNPFDYLRGKAKEEGVEIDDVTFSDPAVAEMQKKLEAQQAENERLKAEQERQATVFAQAQVDKRHADAVAFAQSQVAAHRIPPAAAALFSAVAEVLIAADSTVRFADGEKSNLALFTEALDALPDVTLFTTPQIPNGSGVVFNQTTTPNLDPNAKPSPERIKELLETSDLGREALRTMNGH